MQKKIGRMHEKKMDKDWIKAVTQLCVTAQNSEESMQESIHYLHIMQREYGIDENVFRKIYDEWRKRGEVTEEYMPADARMRKVPLYHRGAEGMCRMLDEGVVEEKMFFEIFWEMPYETIREDKKLVGFYPALPGCIGFADREEDLEKEMQMALKAWIRQAFYMWRENKILEE